MTAVGVLPFDPSVLVGGYSVSDTSAGLSVAFFLSYDGGITWQRPECTTEANCCAEPGARCQLGVADTYGRCLAEYSYYKHCYMAPDQGAITSGSLSADWSTYYIHYEPSTANPSGVVYYLNMTNFGTGWNKLPGAAFGAQRGGRKVFIRGGARSAGCFFQTDFLAEDLFDPLGLGQNSFVSSSNAFSVAASAAGPWRQFTAPWAARAAGALVSGPNATVAYYASGMTFAAGQVVVGGATFGDAWRIDAGVCLLGANAQVCSGHGQPNLYFVSCECSAGYSGTYCEAGSGANAQAGAGAASPSVAAGLTPCQRPRSTERSFW